MFYSVDCFTMFKLEQTANTQEDTFSFYLRLVQTHYIFPMYT